MIIPKESLDEFRKRGSEGKRYEWGLFESEARADRSYLEYRAKRERPEYSYDKELEEYQERITRNELYRDMQIKYQA